MTTRHIQSTSLRLDDILELILKAIIRPATKRVLAPPPFTVFSKTKGAPLHSLPLRSDFLQLLDNLVTSLGPQLRTSCVWEKNRCLFWGRRESQGCNHAIPGAQAEGWHRVRTPPGSGQHSVLASGLACCLRWGMQDALWTFGPRAEVCDVQQVLHKCLLN